MKFKATVRDQRTLAALCHACRSIERRGVLRLHHARTRLFAIAPLADGSQVWAGCRTESIFADFHAQSHQPDNAIYCEVADLSRLLHVLRQAERCPNVSIKLTKNAAKRPALRVSMQGVLRHLDISHDVPVRVLSEAEVQNISAPPLENEVMQVILPSLTELMLFVDKVRSTSCERMTFTAQANAQGNDMAVSTNPPTCSLVIDAECFLANFALKYNSVRLCEREEDEDGEEEEETEGDEDSQHDDSGKKNKNNNNNKRKRRRREKDEVAMQQATVTVEVKRFARFLAIKEITPLQVVLHLVDGKALVLSVSASGGTTLVGYMPAVVH
ncbi:HUS1 checkpoint protein [Trypanosoma theileri]|uniref:Checkpoint protein n=1 Tax=Trypanosoma theileri TaxID=67003 RepID=A0A1X0NG57_9TRYP|nr:HUS1 checkpoint protein [Trypanosoma theileri]ORC83712.1 HUS1 checkpoint protein [Trypanosoma theileri]